MNGWLAAGFIMFLGTVTAPTLAATITPTRTDDPMPNGCLSFDCSLREAAIAAEASPGPDTIVLRAATYTLTNRIGGEAQAYDLDFTGDTTITGHADGTRINAAFTWDNDQSRVVDLVGGRLTLQRVTLADGDVLNADGGCLRARNAYIAIDDGELRECRAPRGGGAALVGSTLHLDSSDIEANTGGGLLLDASSVTQSYSLISWNDAIDGGGIMVVGTGTSILTVLANALIHSNFATRGAGVFVAAGARFEAYGSAAARVQIEANYAVDGAGVYSDGGFVRLEHAQLERNDASNAGGGAWLRSAELVDVLVRDNDADVAAGVAIRCIAGGAACRIARSVFDGNRAAVEAGAIRHDGNSLEISNTQVTNNYAARGPGIVANANITLTHVLGLNQPVPTGGVVLLAAAPAGGTVKVRVANSALFWGCTFEGAVGLLSLGGNAQLADKPACGFNHAMDLPLLPAGEGGINMYSGYPTYYRGPLPGGLLIGSANPAYCAATDIRGYTRTQPCDIGSIETDAAAP